MGDGHIQKFTQAIQLRLIVSFIIIISFTLGVQWCLQHSLGLNLLVSTLIALISGIIASIVAANVIGTIIVRPTNYLAQAIMHISPTEHLVAAPNLDDLKLGHELISTLTRQVYDYATVAEHSQPDTQSIPASLFDQLPVAVVGIDHSDTVVLANNRAKIAAQVDKLVGLSLSELFAFTTDDGSELCDWISEARANSLVDFKIWEKVEIKTINNISVGYFDVAVSFNSDSASGVEVILTLYDHSKAYTNETTSLDFMALAVHEMRTPVTIMRGYIEAFEDELGPALTPRLADDLQKMNASAEGLSSFVSNILNVARINQDKLTLKLEEQNWNTVLPQVVDNLRNRAHVYGKKIELRMQPDMPPVAIDRMTAGEVVTNLVDNAIKYSPNNNEDIRIVSQVNKEGMIETTVQDSGVGIPKTVMSHLFSKFYRNHRNRNQIGGTGLGLFLSKSIITAHGGNIWASSKENEGSTFGFTLLPYDKLATELQTNDNGDIVRSSHGWIKNHSMQRR